MVSPNDSDGYTTSKFKNLSLFNNKNLRHKFTKTGNSVFTAIDQELIKRYNITEYDWNNQFVTENASDIVINIVIIKNGAAGSGYQANTADDSADSSPN
ncbi:MAG: hypothetical protein ACRD8W_01995 [Nitrososphaeraceae archaeon]